MLQKATIGSDIVKEAVPVERLQEDMELKLSELFPKHGQLGKQAVRLLMHLEESGAQKQSELADQLDMKNLHAEQAYWETKEALTSLGVPLPRLPLASFPQ